jgi:hypothetical protein
MDPLWPFVVQWVKKITMAAKCNTKFPKDFKAALMEKFHNFNFRKTSFHRHLSTSMK